MHTLSHCTHNRWWLVLGWVTTKEDHPRLRIAYTRYIWRVIRFYLLTYLLSYVNYYSFKNYTFMSGCVTLCVYKRQTPGHPCFGQSCLLHTLCKPHTLASDQFASIRGRQTRQLFDHVSPGSGMIFD